MSESVLQNTDRNEPENSEMLTIDDLPEEVLLELFSYLLLPDRKHVRLVNKLWNELCNSARFTKHEIIRFTNFNDLYNTNISRAVINLKFDQMEVPNATLQLPFWRDHGCRVKSLKMEFSINRDPTVFDVISYCPNIEHLSLRYVLFAPDFTTHAEIASTKLESLVKLELVDFTVDMLTRNVPNLKHFSLWIRGNIVKNSQFFKDTMLFIKRQSHTLETLCFNGYNFVNDSFLISLSEQVGVQLTGLFIPNCTSVADNFLYAIAKKFVNLERLDLSGNLGLALSMDPTLLSNLKKLKLVDLSNTSITDQALSAVAALEHIEGINLTYCDKLTAKGISRALGAKLHEKILDIRLEGLPCVTDEVLALILPQLPNLRSIDLSACLEITSVGVSSLTANCKLLRLLNLAECSKINSLPVPDMNGLKGLLYLNLSLCPLDADTVGKLKYLELQVISLVDVALTVDSLKSLLVNCPSLQHVELSEESEEDLDLAGLKITLPHETGRKCPNFVTIGTFIPLTIFKLSESHFNRFPCDWPEDLKL